MPITYYIDGYNVIYHCSRLRGIAAQDFESARDQLIDDVSRFCSVTGQHATIVFDGRGQRRQRVKTSCGVTGLKVMYSPTHHSADTVIERYVYSANNRRDIIVVSADRGIRDLCRGLGALVMDSVNFLATVADALQEGSASVERRNTPAILARIEDGLDRPTRERLQALREGLEEPS